AVNGHFVFGFIRYFWNSRKKAVVVFFAVQIISVIGKVQLKRRIGNDVIEFLQVAFFVLVVRVQNGITLNDVLNGMHQVVQNQVESQQARRFLADILRINGAFVLANSVGNVHQ